MRTSPSSAFRPKTGCSSSVTWGRGYGLGIERRDAPPTDTAVWEILARCDGGELRFETKASYRSADGSHVTRQQIRLVAYGDEDGTLIVERAFRQRALGLVDVRRGGQREQYFRFAPLRLNALIGASTTARARSRGLRSACS